MLYLSNYDITNNHGPGLTFFYRYQLPLLFTVLEISPSAPTELTLFAPAADTHLSSYDTGTWFDQFVPSEVQRVSAPV